ncbi:MAG: radical SAM family heme chaperone HemW [Planctomycetota bacterium]|jgi:oxygen-independent coproporphyrinogen-3 oxidase
MEPLTIGACGLYVHVPFCTTKCGYCDFYSLPHGGRNTSRVVECLLAELTGRLHEPQGPVGTIFLGGGTPTVLPAIELAHLLQPLAGLAHTGTCHEFTVEANPATLHDEKAGILVSAGVDRLSLGAQSFHPAELAVLERIHSPEDIAPAVKIARRAGINRLNLDLIFGVPGQTMASWRESLDRALHLDPGHLSLYGLTYEPGTALTRRRDIGHITPCDDRLEADLYSAAIDRLAEAGFRQYEISNFARPGQRCRHNLIYWNHEPYIGVGPSAAGYLDGIRYRNVADIERYVEMIDAQGTAVIETERIEGRRLAGEMAMLQLRLVEGIDTDRFRRRTGLDPRQAFAPAISRHEAAGLLTVTPTRIALTRQGRLVADTLIADFMADLDAPTQHATVPVLPPKKRPTSHSWLRRPFEAHS